MTCNPGGGPAGGKTLTICADGWITSDYPASQVSTQISVCNGAINSSTCDFEGMVLPELEATRSKLVMYEEEDNTDDFGTGTITERQWFINCEVTDQDVSSHDSFILTKIYISRRTTVTPVSLGIKGSSTTLPLAKSGDILQKLWTWKV